MQYIITNSPQVKLTLYPG